MHNTHPHAHNHARKHTRTYTHLQASSRCLARAHTHTHTHTHTSKLLREATHFRLEVELEKIGCLGYLGKLVEAGYNEKGAFSNITDDEVGKTPESNKK